MTFSSAVDDDDDIEILVEDDTPLADKGRPTAPENSDDSLDEGESEEEYSERVRKRIAKETAKLHAERRAKEQAVRERDEAVAFARQALEQSRNLQHQTSQYEQGYVYKAKQAADALAEKASQDYQEAMANGDTQKMVEAQRAMIRAEQEKTQYENYVPRAPVEQVQSQAPAQQTPQVPRVDAEELRRQTKFIQENPWLNKDPEMTERALQIDAHVRQNAPHLVGTDAYYEFVGTMMRQQFDPSRFGNSGQVQSDAPQARSTATQAGVAPVNRGTAPRPRSVTLTESQLRLCKRLGITPQQYAVQLLKGNK